MQRTTLVGCQALTGTPPRSAGATDIVIEGRYIVDVRPAGCLPPEGDEIDARHLLVAPGLINGHTHSHENFHKGRYENLPLEVWMNFVRPPDPIPMTPRQVYLRTLIGVIEALRSGTTTIVDDLNVSPVLVPDHVEAVFKAYDDSGIRAYVAPGMFDRPFFDTVPFLREALPPSLFAELAGKPRTPPSEVMAFLRDLASRRHPSTNRVAAAVSPSAPQRCSTEFLLAARDLALDFDLPIILHVQETRLQVVTGERLYGSTMIAHLDQIGFLGPKLSIIHGVWLNPREIALLAASGASLQHNPTSNFALGSGLCPLAELFRAGVNVSLGTDACASSFSISMLKAVSNAALVQKIRGDDYEGWVSAEQVLAAATIGGARALGRGEELGTIAPGRLADLTGYRLNTASFVPLNDPLRQLVYAETGSSIDLVVIDGEFVIRDGRLTTIDEAAILEEIGVEHAALRAHIETAESEVAGMQAAYDRVYRRCLTESIPADTFMARF